MRVSLVLALTLLLTPTLSPAETIEVPLPELHGPYPLGGGLAERYTEFQLPQVPTAINGAWLRLGGTLTVGELICEGVGSSPWPMEFYAWMKDTVTAGYWSSSNHDPQETGPFETTTAFEKRYPFNATWDHLMDGQGEIGLFGAPAALVGLCTKVSEPSAVIDEAVLVIDVDFPLPVEAGTWGRIKSLYSDPR